MDTLEWRGSVRPDPCADCISFATPPPSAAWVYNNDEGGAIAGNATGQALWTTMPFALVRAVKEYRGKKPSEPSEPSETQ
jgi:hypothetical protein